MITPIDAASANKLALGHGELIGILVTGTHTSIDTDGLGFGYLSCAEGTMITELEFTTDFGQVASVTRYNGIAVVGGCIIPPVYNRMTGYWSKVVFSGGQICAYGRNPIG
jgi:hypothetical protein